MSTIDPTDGYTDAERAELDELESQDRAAHGELETTPADEAHRAMTDQRGTGTSGEDREPGSAGGAFGDDLPPSLAPQTADETALRDVFPIDVESHAKYPVEKARAFAADELVPTQVYATPWGNRAMTDHEVGDLRKQGLTIEPVDSAPTDSLQGDKDDMAHVPFRAE